MHNNLDVSSNIQVFEDCPTIGTNYGAINVIKRYFKNKKRSGGDVYDV